MEEQPTNTSKGARGAGGNGSNGPKSARGHATGITGPSADVKRFNAGDAARLLAERYQAALTAAQVGFWIRIRPHMPGYSQLLIWRECGHEKLLTCTRKLNCVQFAGGWHEISRQQRDQY